VGVRNPAKSGYAKLQNRRCSREMEAAQDWRRRRPKRKKKTVWIKMGKAIPDRESSPMGPYQISYEYVG